MEFFRDKKFRDAALGRAIRTVCQSLGSNLPVGLVITPVMIQKADWSIFYLIIAWILTGLLAGLASLLTSISKGLPEYPDSDMSEDIYENISDNDSRFND
jgi:hypothetical protein